MENLEQVLKNHGLRTTLFRVQVMEIFQNSTHALALPDIEDVLGDFDRITLYRTLKSFEEKGMIHKIADHTGLMKYALCEGSCDEGHHHDQHVHFHCDRCGKSFCMDSLVVPPVSAPSGYTVTASDMMLKGICKNCNEIEGG